MTNVTVEEARAVLREDSIKRVKEILAEGNHVCTVHFHGDNVDIKARLNPDFTWEWCE
jgi:regulator of replication initiation timing